MFELSLEEFKHLRSQIVTSNKRDTQKELDDIYLALSQLADKQKQINKQKERKPIGFIHYKDKEETQE